MTDYGCNILGRDTVLGTGDDRICIAVLDGPVDCSHSCFRNAKLTQLQTLVERGRLDGRALAHGTHVASIIFAQRGSPVSLGRSRLQRLDRSNFRGRYARSGSDLLAAGSRARHRNGN